MTPAEVTRQVSEACGCGSVDCPERIKVVAAALAACAREEAVPLLKYAIHKNTCKGFPAFSEAQLALDCNCGLQAIKTRLRALERAVGEKADTKA